MICIRCGGTGKYFGNGMMLTNCACDDKIIDKKSGAYAKAIKEIKKLDKNIDDAKAEKLFKETFDKV